MRLLKIGGGGELSFTKDLIDSIPSYAILSHTWGDYEEEVTFNDLKDELTKSKSKAGYTKIQFCVEQAQREGLQYLWVDTCCIDKANHVELAEAINSMFCWYRNAAKCYVFLSEVSARKRDNAGLETRIPEKQMVHTWLDPPRAPGSERSRVLFSKRTTVRQQEYA